LKPLGAALLWLLLVLSATFACTARPGGQTLPTLAATAQPLALVTDTAVPTASQTLLPTYTVMALATREVGETATSLPTAEPPAATALLPTITSAPTPASAPATETATPTAVVPTNTPLPLATNTATMYPTVMAPANTAGPPPPTPSAAWPVPTAHPFPVSTTPRQGIAAVLNGGATPIDDTTLGQWQYAYGPYMRFTFTDLQHVPLLVGGPRNGLTGTAFIVEMDQRSEHDYWLVFNECEHQLQCAATPQEAAEFFRHQVVEVLFNQGADANAQLIIGGVNAHPCGIDWLENFVSYYEANYGELPHAGWHFHLYPEIRPGNWPANCGGDWEFDDLLFPNPQAAFELWRTHARSTLEFVQQYGDRDDEIWFTEIGCLNSGNHQQEGPVCPAPGFMAGYVPLMLEWLNNEGRWVTRYAWYTDWDTNYWNYTKLYQTVDGTTTRELRPAGLFYSQVRAAEAIPLPWPDDNG
jgi:hypothetical protein